MLKSLDNKSVSLVFFDPQYEKAGSVMFVDYPLHFQSENQIIVILKEIERILKPSGFCLLWVNKEVLKSDRVQNWLIKTTKLNIVDFLVWLKRKIGMGSYFRSSGEYAWLLQKNPTNSKKFTNRCIPNIWKEDMIGVAKRKHPHQKPYFLIRTLIEATTKEEELVVDPCAGSFVVLDACQQTNRNFLGVDLTINDLQEYNQEKAKEKGLVIDVRENNE